MKKDLLSEYDLERADFESIFEGAHRLKRLLREGKEHPFEGQDPGDDLRQILHADEDLL